MQKFYQKKLSVESYGEGTRELCKNKERRISNKRKFMNKKQRRYNDSIYIS